MLNLKVIAEKLFTVYNNHRIKLINKYLLKTVINDEESLSYYWQPMIFSVCKIVIMIMLFFYIYSLHAFAGDMIQKAFNFFKLHEIFNFKFPDKSFFYNLIKIAFLLFFLYYGSIFFVQQIEAFFSVLVINNKDRKIYYIKNRLLIKNLYIFQAEELKIIILKQSIIGKIINFGTIILQTPNCIEIKISLIYNARKAVKEISNIKNLLNNSKDSKKRGKNE